MRGLSAVRCWAGARRGVRSEAKKEEVSLILMRHGQSRWNARNRFTGWVDVALTPQGEQEAWAAGRLIGARQLEVAAVYTSELSRAQKTTELLLRSLRQSPQVETSWRLNERHYGGLTSLHKTETMERWGAERVMAMRRGADRPPLMDPSHPMYEHIVAGREALVRSGELPLAESLPQTRERVWEYWRGHILPKLRDELSAERKRAVLVVSHLHTIRLLIAELDGLSREELLALDVPTAVPLLYEMSADRLADLGRSEEEHVVKGKWLGETGLASMRVSAIRSLLLRRRGLLYELLPYLPEAIQRIFTDGEKFRELANQAAATIGDSEQLKPRDQVAALRALYPTRPWIGVVDVKFADACARALHAVTDDDDAPPRYKYDGLRTGYSLRPPARFAASKLNRALFADIDASCYHHEIKRADFPALARLVAVAAYLAWIQKNGAEFLPEKEYRFASDVAKTGLLSQAEIDADLAGPDGRPYSRRARLLNSRYTPDVLFEPSTNKLSL